jgi:hypothetical protein
MANSNIPFGFRWHGLSGDPVTPSSGLIAVKVAASPGHTFGEGDPLQQLYTGYVDALTKGASLNALIGVFKSCEYYSTSQARKVWRNYYPTGDATGDVTVYMEAAGASITPRFVVQSGGTAAITFGNVGMNIDILTGSSTAGTVTSGYYRSACAADASGGVTTTSTVPFRIVGLWSDYAPPGAPGTDNTTAYNWIVVEANPLQKQGI